VSEPEGDRVTHRASVKDRARERVLRDVVPGADLGAREVDHAVTDEGPLLPPSEREQLVRELLADLIGLGPLEPLLADPAVTDLMVNGGGAVWIERRGRLERTLVVLDEAAVLHIIEKIVAPLGLRVDRASPLVDARLPDGSRVNAVVAPLAVDGPCLTIRRFGAVTIPLRRFAPPDVAALLRDAVVARRNIVVCGGTGSGKTTLLNALAAEIPTGERIVTVEDAAELRLPQDHVVRLEARPANAEGAGEVRVRDLVRNALRMRPDRIVVGECRGPEALDMLQAMNTGHEGSLSTCHANGADDALRRLETMVLMGEVALPLDAVREQLASALDLLVVVSRQSSGRRRVVEVAEVRRAPDADGTRTRVLADARAVVAPAQRPARR
jgi:pilus assembly protein CpaF